MYTISVFSLDLWEGKVLCNRPSLAMGIHRGTLACIRTYVCWGIQLKCARGVGRGRETKLYAYSYTYIEPCACVCGRDFQMLCRLF